MHERKINRQFRDQTAQEALSNFLSQPITSRDTSSLLSYADSYERRKLQRLERRMKKPKGGVD